MARLHEHQGKRLLAEQGVAVPEGDLAATPEACQRIAERLGGTVVIKAQVWGTGRARAGGIRFAETPAQAAEAARHVLGHPVGGSTVEAVLVEKYLTVEREFYVGYFIDDQLHCPVLLLSAIGGTGIEERSRSKPETMVRLPVSVRREPSVSELLAVVKRSGAPLGLHAALAGVMLKLYRAARANEARMAEINPLALTFDHRLVALDCRFSVDDYAVFRHPELGIDIAREFGHPPTELDRIAWEVERDDYRGTFYFVQLQQNHDESGVRIGFHGAGGGGAMASLDAAMRSNLRPANFTDTSGNPTASKVYRAARIILSQPGIRGYFLSGSGVASQEQFHLARAVVKAFREVRLSVPAVLRLGGNGEELAAKIVRDYTADLPAPVEAYPKDYSADFCAQRLNQLIRQNGQPKSGDTGKMPVPRPNAALQPYAFQTRTGQITFDHAVCLECESKICLSVCPPQILSLEKGLPVLNITRDEAHGGKCIECLACEVECWFHGKGGAAIDLPIPGLDG